MFRIDKIELTYTLSQQEYLRAVQQYLQAAGIVHKRDLVILPLLLLGAIVGLFLTHFNGWMLLVFLLALFTNVLGGLVFFFKPWYEYGKIAQLREEVQLSCSDEGMHMEKPGVESDISWELFGEVWENRDFFYLIQRPRLYSIIPKRVFASTEERQLFIRLLYRNIGTVEIIGRFSDA